MCCVCFRMPLLCCDDFVVDGPTVFIANAGDGLNPKHDAILCIDEYIRTIRMAADSIVDGNRRYLLPFVVHKVKQLPFKKWSLPKICFSNCNFGYKYAGNIHTI